MTPATLFHAFVALFVAEMLARLILLRLERERALSMQREVPAGFEGVCDEATLLRMARYTAERSRFSAFRRATGDLLLLGLIFFGFFPWLSGCVEALGMGPVLSGIAFFSVTALLLALADAPFDFLATFGVERRFGFSRETPGGWLRDRLKAGAVGFVLMAAALGVVLALFEAAPGAWWLWAFVALTALQVALAVLYPVLIAPLFNRFTPLSDAGLAARVRELLQRAGVRVSGVFTMDAGRRTRHTNAYFSGLGRHKRIVLYDTLIASHPEDELLAVLAHEAGHERRRHVLWGLALSSALLFAGLWGSAALLDAPALSQAFGFRESLPYAGLFFLAVAWGKALFFARPLIFGLSRRFEREADAFAARLMASGKPLASALRRLACDNLANLDPHPLVVLFTQSHPPVAERVRALGGKAGPRGRPPESLP